MAIRARCVPGPTPSGLAECRPGRRPGSLECAAAALLLLWAAAFAQEPAPNVLLARIKSHMAENLRNLTNYVCLETIERSRCPARTAMLVTTDRLKLEVAHVGERELYAWPGDEEFGKLDIGTFSGMIGSGAFALRARTLFLTSDATFHYAGKEKSKGRELVRYDFQVPANAKRFFLNNAGTAGFVGEHGSFWADAQSLDIVRLRGEAEEIPPEIGIRSSFTEIEYQRSPIAGTEFLLPARAELRLMSRSGQESRNITTFSTCHKYEVKSSLSFDLPPAPDHPADQPTPRPASLVLPAGLELSITLLTPIDNRKLATGDPIEGRLTADAIEDDKLLVPAGALVRGRLRRLEVLPDYRNALLVALDFHLVEFGNQTATFSAELQSFQKLAGVADVLQVPRSVLASGNWLPENVQAPSVSGVGSLFLTGRTTLPAGFGMIWRTTAAPNPVVPAPRP